MQHHDYLILLIMKIVTGFFVAIPLSIDHKPDRSDERQRIEDAGGFVIWAGEIESSWVMCLFIVPMTAFVAFPFRMNVILLTVCNMY